MSSNGEEHKWICGVGAVGLQRVSSIVREIREPCLHHSPVRGSKMLKPDKWQALFDSEGRVLDFRKILRLIVLGGVDPSIRAEVWEFLLGCYALGTTAEYRQQLRIARREKYLDLIRECQKMHPSIGSGNLAYVVGSKLMDVRTLSREEHSNEADLENESPSQNPNNKEIAFCHLNSGHRDAFYDCQTDSSSDSDDDVSLRESTDITAYDHFSFPPLPVTDLFQNIKKNMPEYEQGRSRYSASNSHKSKENALPGFRMNDNDLAVESSGSSNNLLFGTDITTNICSPDAGDEILDSTYSEYNTSKRDKSSIPDMPKATVITGSPSNGLSSATDKISDWLWTLHRIVVDVVRTDSHLDFYNDAKNMARMSDILAIYAWVDPATGYCQGMSDLLSPFVVLYEDNADAFWCFEMLLRRMRENFQMEGPTGVIKRLQALWRVLEYVDTDIFTHLSLIGAESLHFAFRMLLVLFRRELSFNEALCMWEMMWAADFNEATLQELAANCLDQLVIQLHGYSSATEIIAEYDMNDNKLKEVSQLEARDLEYSRSCDSKRSASRYPLCGLATASFWVKNDDLLICSSASLTKNGVELPVFCVAAILILNRQLILRATHSLDDLIKIFNDNILKINVRRCVRTAIRLRKKYFNRLIKQISMDDSGNGAAYD